MNTHIVGIKGAGVSALAKILHARGDHVCGSDVGERFFTCTELEREGILAEPFSASHVAADSIDRVIYSTAWKDSDEVRAARARDIPVASYPEALGALFNEAATRIAVAGSHGKTTTTGMVSHILKSAGHDITAVIGSTLTQYGTNAFAGKESLTVIEADEYENKLAYYHPSALIVTSIDYDHPDFFPDSRAYDEVFATCVRDVHTQSGIVVACTDDVGVRRVCDSTQTVTYGTDSSCRYRAVDIRVERGRMQYTLQKDGVEEGHFSIGLPGMHNVLNALGASALCDTLGLVPLKTAAEYAGYFQGTARRFEYKGTRGNTRVYDDFAHHPTEIAATLKAARELFPGKRIWCVFGAHTYTRTRVFLNDFAASFSAVDRALILAIYGSAREQSGGIHGRDVAVAIAAQSGNAEYVGTREHALKQIMDHIDEIDILITIGAGDVWHIADALVTKQ